jgi:hypothetical protein
MKLKTIIILVAFVVFVTNAASGCPVCYGETDVHTASAVNAAIYSLLIVTGMVLSFFVSLILQLRKRLKLSSTNRANNIE